MSRIAAPKGNIPIGTVLVNGKSFDVAQHPEFTRWFFALMQASGVNDDTTAGVDGLYQAPPAVQAVLDEAQALRTEVNELRDTVAELTKAIQSLQVGTIL